MCGRVINTSNSASGGLGFKPCRLRCFFRQGPLLHFVSLHLGVGTSNILLGGWGGGGAQLTSKVLHAKETGISSGHLGFWLACAFPFYLYLTLFYCSHTMCSFMLSRKVLRIFYRSNLISG